jgi:hypothetical protein
MGTFITTNEHPISGLGTYRSSASIDGKTVSIDPRLVSIMQTAASLSPYNVVAFSGVAGRAAGTSNHPGGYAMDVYLQDPKTGELLTNYGGSGFQQEGSYQQNFPAYEQFAQTARVVQQQQYPELNDTFRWGGYFNPGAGNSTPDLMHFDVTPKMDGAMGGGTWDDGATRAFEKRFGISSDGGLANNQEMSAQLLSTMSGKPVPPADIPGNVEAPPFPLSPPAGYGSSLPADTPALSSPIDPYSTGTDTGLGWGSAADSGLPFDASTPINVAPPAAPVVTAPSGNTYVAGDVYQTADGASFRANSDGSFTKVANTPRQVTPIQLLLDSQVPGAQQNLANTVNSIENVAQTAGSKAGDFFKSLFSSGAPAAAAAPAVAAPPNSSGSPDDRGGAPFSYSAPVAMNSSGSPDDRDPDPSVGVTTWQSLLGVPTPTVGTTPVPGLPNPYSVSSGPFNYGGSPDDRQAAENAANSGARQTNSGIAGTVQLPSGVTPAGAASAEAQAVQANGGSRSSSPATFDDGGWSSLLTAVGDAPFSSPAPTITTPTSAPATTHGTDESPAFTTKTEIEQVANPAYSAWLKDQNSAIYGVEGVDTPSLDANGNVVLPSSYAGASVPKAPAPPKTIAKPITVKIPVKPAAPLQLEPAAQAPISPIASTNGYTYVPNGNGGYTRVGVVNPSLSPSQQYAKAAAPALNDGNPNGAAGMGSSNPNVHSNGSLV